MEKKRVQGYIAAGIGFTFLISNALSYIFDWNTKSTALTVMGLVFVIIGLKMARTQQ